MLVNTVIWDNHASALGIFFLCICITGGILYQQEMKSAVLTKSAAKEHMPVSQEDSEDNENQEVEMSKT